MNYPKNDLWSVRQIEYLQDALDGYENKSAIYYPEKTVGLDIPGIESYEYRGVLHFPGSDRTIIFEQGDEYGLKQEEIADFLKLKNVNFEVRKEGD